MSKRLEKKRIRERLSPNTTLPNSLVFSPIEDWSNDDVWLYLMQVKNPWGFSNKDLLTMYQGANPDGECPLVVDTSTPSCGDSRFGCWVCTLVDKDKSMTAMIQNDQEKDWMYPLLEFRNQLDLADDRHLRDFRRLSGKVQLFHDRTIPGPYTQEARENWLRKLLEVQSSVQQNAPPEIQGIELVSLEELQEIRRIWVVEKHELEDNLPRIYESVTRKQYPGKPLSDNALFGSEEIKLLQEICGDDHLHFELTRELLDVEQRFRTQARRSGLYPALEKAFKRGFFDGEQDALEREQYRHRALESAGSGLIELPEQEDKNSIE
ncbi:DNA phosphorothioation system sulfurtransferase DndC, partial [bacterium]|nr:DNA phosphorothioation system sulfurtransferase DndC [bacterium]